MPSNCTLVADWWISRRGSQWEDGAAPEEVLPAESSL